MLLFVLACQTSSAPPTPAETPDNIGHCTYTNPFSQGEECKEYSGDNWSETSASSDCEAPMPGAAPGVFTWGDGCDRSALIGECIVDGTNGYTLVFSGGSGDDCGGLELGCSFAQGEFIPTEACSESGGGPVNTGIFQPYEQVCAAPMVGEPDGMGPDGEVCTWQAISGSTEDGRYFADYADCDVVRTQRPYWPAAAEVIPGDPARVDDPDWVAEYDWVTRQVEASACMCCHSSAESPDNTASGWYLEAEPVWTDTLDDDGMAMMAGWVDSSVFGAFDPADNNGFSRDTTGVPTTDPDRMRAFFAGELLARGRVESDFAQTPPFGGPLYDQLVYEPEPCTGDQGLSDSGELTWGGGSARYLYVLEADAAAPGVPPNLDLPDGTLWRLDVSPEESPIASGLGYGQVPSNATQRYPASGGPAQLVSGETYYLYALADVMVPLTRCLFQAP